MYLYNSDIIIKFYLQRFGSEKKLTASSQAENRHLNLNIKKSKNLINQQ